MPPGCLSARLASHLASQPASPHRTACQATMPGDGVVPGMGEDVDLDTRQQEVLESMTFVDIGVDSLAGVDLIRHIQAEISVPMPMTFVYDFPTVKQAVSEVLAKINASHDPFLRGKMCTTFWRALRQVLGVDPVSAVLEGRLGRGERPEVSEEEALAILQELKAAYEEASWVQTARTVAKKVAFEHRAFLVALRVPALEVQRPVLEARGFEPSQAGLRRLEQTLARAAAGSELVRGLLRDVRVAQQGGANGMWAVNMEADAGHWDDSNSIQCWAQYVKADPFGPDRRNTKSAMVA